MLSNSYIFISIVGILVLITLNIFLYLTHKKKIITNKKNYESKVIENLNFEEFCKMLISNYGDKWNTDEHFMFDKFQNNLDKVILKERDLSRRIDRSFWTYDIRLLQSGYYIDSHMLRPYQQYKKNIDELLTIIYRCG
jgi:hypothetical protein